MKPFLLCLVYIFVSVKGQRIAGGESADIINYPFAVSLLTNGGVQNAAFTHICGGSILRSDIILSAASCFTGANGVTQEVSRWRARVGSSSSRSGGTIHFINNITRHPDFQFNTRQNDIALVRPTVSIMLRPGVVEVAKIAGAAYTFGVNQPVLAIGWGAPSEQTSESSEHLRRVQFWTINQQTCANRYNALNFTVTNNMVCVGWLDVGIRGQCAGDAGSPLLDADNAVVGVFSWAQGCADSWYPDINTRVASYTRWILATVYG